jgi:hypothetical protein
MPSLNHAAIQKIAGKKQFNQCGNQKIYFPALIIGPSFAQNLGIGWSH